MITDPDIQRRVLLEVLNAAEDLDFNTLGVIRSPLRGPAGNEEFLAWFAYPDQDQKKMDLEKIVNAVF